MVEAGLEKNSSEKADPIELQNLETVILNAREDLRRCELTLRHISSQLDRANEIIKVPSTDVVGLIFSAEESLPNVFNANEEERKQEQGQFAPLIFEFGEHVRCFDWHQVERHWSGKPYRWSGPGIDPIVVLEVPRSCPYVVTIDLVGVMDPLALTSIKVFCDGRPLPCFVSPNQGGWQLRFEVPASDRAIRNEVELTFKVLATLIPSVVANQPDDRLLGIAVSQFRFDPAVTQ